MMDSQKLKNSLIQLLKILLPIGVGIYLVIHIYNSLDQSQRIALFDSFEKANYIWVVVSFGMGLLSHYIRGYRWKFQLEAMGYHPTTMNNFLAVMLGYITNMVLPRVGEVSRAMALSKYEKIPFQKTFGTILAERAVDMIILLIITVTTVILQFELLRGFVDQISGKATNILSSPLVWIAVVLVLIAIPISIFIARRHRENALISKINNLVEGLLEGLRSILRMEKRVLYFFSSIAIWVLYVGMFWVCFYSLEATSHLPVNAVFAGFILGSFAIVLVPGGIGAFPVALMQGMVIYGVAEETGFALGWIIWFSQTTLVVLVGGLSMLYLPIYNKSRRNVGSDLPEV